MNLLAITSTSKRRSQYGKTPSPYFTSTPSFTAWRFSFLKRCLTYHKKVYRIILGMNTLYFPIVFPLPRPNWTTPPPILTLRLNSTQASMALHRNPLFSTVVKTYIPEQCRSILRRLGYVCADTIVRVHICPSEICALFTALVERFPNDIVDRYTIDISALDLKTLKTANDTIHLP